MFEKCNSRSETRADVTSKSHLAIERWPSEPSAGENESSSIAAIDNGYMSGYGISLSYRRIRGRLSCQSAYRSPLINSRKRSLLSFLTWHGVCGNQPSPSCDLHPSLVYTFSLLIIYPPSLLFVFRSSVVYFSLVRELKISNLPNANTCNIDPALSDCLRQWLHVQAMRFVQIRNFQYQCVAVIQGWNRAKLLLNIWTCLKNSIFITSRETIFLFQINVTISLFKRMW